MVSDTRPRKGNRWQLDALAGLVPPEYNPYVLAPVEPPGPQLTDVVDADA